ncbi:alanine racemase [Klebsiella pneumoniae]|uniref:alanine racemase n=1 Tax=Klebsiella pneumoniae TaxID=573 RepID=UPI00388F3CFE
MQAATVVINRRALRHNLQRLRELAPASKLVAVVKANAYGHGLLETARTLTDADAFGVARLEEALRLRAGGIAQPILLLEGFFAAEDLAVIAAQRLHTAVHSPEQLAALEQADLPEPVTVWMKLDTGMHRLGVAPEQAGGVLSSSDPVQKRSSAGEYRQPFCATRMNQNVAQPRSNSLSLIPFYEGKPGQRSIAASGGILLWPQSHFDCARASFFTAYLRWKIAPTGADFGCQPVMR